MLSILFTFLISILNLGQTPKTTYVSQTKVAPKIDGKATEACWAKAKWMPIDQLWVGKQPTKADFNGRYKLTWDKNYLYVLAEITDDTLIDIHTDPLDRYWDDDCLEVFIDPDHSGGDHLASFNAWAYHTALNNVSVDFGADGKPHDYSSHVISKHITKGNKTIWEAAYAIYPDTYVDGAANKPEILKAGKEMGFAIAYCDNDYSPEREHFIGSEVVEGDDKNQGYKTASIFGKIILK